MPRKYPTISSSVLSIYRVASPTGEGDLPYYLPDNQETLKATEVLAGKGFTVIPYMYPDLNLARILTSPGIWPRPGRPA
jgi:hypothetical protein